MLSKKAFTICCHPELDSGSSRLIKKGFTLIELLVVVLIIGILAAVAVPQYKNIMAWNRIARYLPLANAIEQAQERYVLATGSYTTRINQLDITLPQECQDIGTATLKCEHNVNINYNYGYRGGLTIDVFFDDTRQKKVAYLRSFYTQGYAMDYLAPYAGTHDCSAAGRYVKAKVCSKYCNLYGCREIREWPNIESF